MRLLFDLETNGLLDRKDLKILCGAAVDVDTGREYRWDPRSFEYDPLVDCAPAWHVLSQADELIGHNIAGFDLPVLERFAPEGWEHTDRIYDTVVASRQMYYSNLIKRTAAFRNKAGKREEDREARFPRKLLSPFGMHKLEAWGYRLGYKKGDFLSLEGVQEEYSDELLEYCLRDVHLNVKLWKHLTTKPAIPGSPVTPYEAMVVESQVQYWLERQQRNGVGFDESRAVKLYAHLAGKREELIQQLQEYFPDYYVPKGKVVVPKRTQSSKKVGPGEEGYKNVAKGEPYQPVQLVQFTGTRHQIADRLQKLYGWRPTAFGDDGIATVDESVLAGLTYEPVPALLELLMVKKRIGQLAEGNKAWLRLVKDGKLHGRVAATGARTSRAAHSNPNLGQVPKGSSPYGPECRDLFRPTRPGWAMVGADASGLQLRMLAHYLGKYDDGAFTKVLLEADPHSAWMEATGIRIRDYQKTFTYAMIFGAGDEKLGMTIIDDWRAAERERLTEDPVPHPKFARSLGKSARAGLMQHVPGLGQLMRECKAYHKQGWAEALDGRIVGVVSEHGALNDLLQSGEAVVMKHALVGLVASLTGAGLRYGRDWAFLLNVHDEWQLETAPNNADVVGEHAVDAIRLAGINLGLRCPLDGEYKVGASWKETH